MRFMTLVLVGVFGLGAAGVQAAEKLPDRMNVAAKTAFNAPVSGSLTAASGTYDRIYSQGDVSPGCGAVVFDSANDGMYYDLYCLQVDDTEPISLIVDANGTTIFDTVLTLYCDPFDPGNPAENVVAFDDDSGEGTLSAFTAARNIVLQPGREYWLVVSSYGAGMTGDYVIQPSSNVFDCGVVSREHTSWGSVKGMYR